MLWPATLLGAAGGFALASIPGALLGALLGQVVDRRLRLQSWAALRERLGGQAEIKPEQLQFVLLGRLAKSTGRVLPAHIQQAQAEMQRLGLGVQAQRLAIEAFNRGKSGRDHLRGPLRRQRDNAQPLLRACWRMAWIEGQVSKVERELITQWANWLEVPPVLQAQLAQGYTPRQEAPLSTALSTYQRALKLLGVAEDDQPAQIKQAYRRLLSRHHPDKLAGSGAAPEQVRAATERTRELHQAYEVVRQRHGFR
ncbi:DnaJ domain-containing protein [Pseudomonas sp. 5P_3.1_Bac2]|uniref:DnaJ domain-containing protein n=1 Tax=Pseudomonas sp. 5P_3.1_Bac2 TaxID=2971617 RepID=UPI0021C7F0B2|nr:DnaJ domain-containing protein [Pseudomonas sp. 5P_3.1_Bac2]MCU1717517.1 DnaJ domain-containing protein [Pseudomonas sp. 5P_3.1_Bac2]